MRHSITSRLILLVTLAAGSIIAIGLLVDYHLSRKELLQSLTTESRHTAIDVVEDLDSLLRRVEHGTLLIRDILSQRAFSRQGLEQIVRDAIRNSEDVAGATIALAVGPDQHTGFATYYFSAKDGPVRHDLSDTKPPYWQRHWFADAVDAGQPQWSNPYPASRADGTYVMTYSAPVFHRTENGSQALYAVLTADIELEEVRRYLTRLRLGENGFGFLVSDNGQLVTSRITDPEVESFARFIADPGERQHWLDAVAQARPGADLNREFHCALFDDNCFLHLTRLNHTGWVLGMAYSEREVLGQLREFGVQVLIVSVLSLLGMALAIAFVTRRVTHSLTALAETADAYGEGRFDAPLPVAQGHDEVTRLVRSFGHMKDELTRYVSDLAQATASRSRIEGELAAAREIQMSMLPQRGHAVEFNPHFQLWASIRPARSVGGDLFSYRVSHQRLYFAIGDVSDKGVPAALFMARTLSHLQSIDSESPGHALGSINNSLVERNDNFMFVTLLIGVIDLHTLTLTFASAGHPPPLLLHQGEARILAQQSGPATGLAADQNFPDNQVELRPGDRLITYTDGFDEAFSGEGEMFGDERLKQLIASTDQLTLTQAAETILDQVDQFTAGTAQSDDLALLLIDLPPAITGSERRLSLTPGPELVNQAIHWLQQQLPDTLSPIHLNETALLTEEAITNIAKYAQLSAGDAIELTLCLAPTSLALQVSDSGLAFNPLAEEHRSPPDAQADSAESGSLGLHLIHHLTDWRSYHRVQGRNYLELGYRFTAHPHTADTTVVAALDNTSKAGIMKLTTRVDVDASRSVAKIYLKGSLNSDTAPAFDPQLDQVLAKGMRLNVLDMRDLDYISSAGLRVIFKGARHAVQNGQRLAASHRKPHIEKVFEILKALPDMAIFASDQELDDYLDAMQSRVQSEP